MKDLKPCPFCGGEALLKRSQEHPFVICKDCNARSDWFGDYDLAIKRWNRRASGWISVKDRLPEKETACWIWDDSIPKVERIAMIGVYFNNKFKIWCPCKTHDEKCFNQKVNVTHWMPLPEPPENNNGND